MEKAVKCIPAGKIAAGVVYVASFAAGYMVGKGFGMIPAPAPVKFLASTFVGGVLGKVGGKMFMELWNSDWNIDIDIETHTKRFCSTKGFNADGTPEEAERSFQKLIKEARDMENGR